MFQSRERGLTKYSSLGMRWISISSSGEVRPNRWEQLITQLVWASFNISRTKQTYTSLCKYNQKTSSHKQIHRCTHTNQLEDCDHTRETILAHWPLSISHINTYTNYTNTFTIQNTNANIKIHKYKQRQDKNTNFQLQQRSSARDRSEHLITQLASASLKDLQNHTRASCKYTTNTKYTLQQKGFTKSHNSIL